jgi:hypothetical protein
VSSAPQAEPTAKTRTEIEPSDVSIHRVWFGCCVFFGISRFNQPMSFVLSLAKCRSFVIPEAHNRCFFKHLRLDL